MFTLSRSDQIKVRLTRHGCDGYGRMKAYIANNQPRRFSRNSSIYITDSPCRPYSSCAVARFPTLAAEYSSNCRSQRKRDASTRKALTTEARASASSPFSDDAKILCDGRPAFFAEKGRHSRNHLLETLPNKSRRQDPTTRQARRESFSPMPKQPRRARSPRPLYDRVSRKIKTNISSSTAARHSKHEGIQMGYPQYWRREIAYVARTSRLIRQNIIEIEKGIHLVARKSKKAERRLHEAALAAMSELERRKIIAAALRHQEKGTQMWSWAPLYLNSGEQVSDAEYDQIQKLIGCSAKGLGERSIREETKMRIDAYYNKFGDQEYLDIRRPFSALDWARIDHFYCYLDLPRNSPRLQTLLDYYERVYRPNDKDLAFDAHNFRAFLLLRLLTNRLPGCWQHLTRRTYLLFPLQEQEDSMKRLIDEIYEYNNFCRTEKPKKSKPLHQLHTIPWVEVLKSSQDEMHRAYDRVVWSIIDSDRRKDSEPEKERHRIMHKFTGILQSLGNRGPVGEIAKLNSQLKTMSETMRFSKLLKIGSALKASSFSLKHAIERFEEFIWLSCMRRAAMATSGSDGEMGAEKWTHKTGLASRIKEERRIIGHLNLRPTNRIMEHGSFGTALFADEADRNDCILSSFQENEEKIQAKDDGIFVDDDTYAPLAYQIPETVMRQAMLASSTSAAAYWQYDLYEGPQREKVKVHYCRSRETTERIAQLFLDKKVLGFDIEWKPHALAHEGIKKNVSLIQLASEDRIGLFHIARYSKGDTIEDLVAPTLKTILESADISKVGVSIKADCTRLRRFLNIEPRGLFELSHLYKLVKFSSHDVSRVNKRLVSLAQQVEEHLQLPMRKGEVRSSNWADELNMQQIIYAASDSYAGLRLFDILEQKRLALDPRPPRPSHAELNLPIRLADGHTMTTTADEPTEIEDDPVAASDPSSKDSKDSNTNATQSEQPNRVEVTSTPATEKKPSEVAQAEAWTSTWRTSLPVDYKPRASPAHLRAYALWQEQSFDVPVVARLLRDPPLQASTVSTYILEAIRLEKLPYDKDRIKDVIKDVPEGVYERRYRALKRDLEE